MTTGTLAAIGALGTVPQIGAEARRSARQALCSCQMRATRTHAVANSTMLTRCCTAREVVTLVKCTPPTPATSAGVPTRKTNPSITSRCIKEKRAERAGYAKECGDHVVPSFVNAYCRSVDTFQRKNTLSRTINRDSTSQSSIGARWTHRIAAGMNSKINRRSKNIRKN